MQEVSTWSESDYIREVDELVNAPWAVARRALESPANDETKPKPEPKPEPKSEESGMEKAGSPRPASTPKEKQSSSKKKMSTSKMKTPKASEEGDVTMEEGIRQSLGKSKERSKPRTKPSRKSTKDEEVFDLEEEEGEPFDPEEEEEGSDDFVPSASKPAPKPSRLRKKADVTVTKKRKEAGKPEKRRKSSDAGASGAHKRQRTAPQGVEPLTSTQSEGEYTEAAPLLPYTPPTAAPLAMVLQEQSRPLRLYSVH